MNRRLLFVTSLAGGLAAATLLQMSSAHADDFVFSLEPGTGNFDTELSTVPFQNVLEGTSGLNVLDSTTNFGYNNFFQVAGNETLNPFTGAVESFDVNVTSALGSLTGNPYLETITVGTQIDVLELGSGYANQFVDIPGIDGAMNSISDLLITPFGDYTLFAF